MKKVAIVYSGAKYQGGIEVYLESLFKYYDRKRIDIVLISLGDWQLTEKAENMKVQTKIITGGRIRPQTFFDIKKLIKRENISLVVSQGVVANFYARIGAKLAHVPHLTTVHSDLSAEYANPFISLAYGLSDFITRPLTSRYIAASKYLKSVLVSKGVKKDKIKVIYHGVNAPAVKEKSKGQIVVGSLGRLDKVKGYANLIEAFSMLGPTDAKLVIWGEGNERKGLETLVKKLDLEDKVEMPGYIDDVGEALSQVDIYIQPSLSEGLGLAVIEAALARKPVIVTPSGALTEIIEDGKTGFISKDVSSKAVAETIKRVFDSSDQIQNIVDRAEKEARDKFSISKSVAETVDVYLEMANSKLENK
ncbi:MAG: glycosyltransferase family 4 protein [bacterium]|nr:glycosyltransferase family 4 protein [bacterium]